MHPTISSVSILLTSLVAPHRQVANCGKFSKDAREFSAVSSLSRHIMQPPTVLAQLQSSAPSVSVADPPSEAVHHIIRHLSSTPRIAQWTCNVNADVVRALLLADGPFPSAAALIFDTITTVDGSVPPDTPSARGGAVVPVWSFADRERLTNILASLSMSCTTAYSRTPRRRVSRGRSPRQHTAPRSGS